MKSKTTKTVARTIKVAKSKAKAVKTFAALREEGYRRIARARTAPDTKVYRYKGPKGQVVAVQVTGVW